MVGSCLDRRFRIDERLAEGGFGTVYRATDTDRATEVAIKVLHSGHASNASIVERFRREAAALARLRDPHTVTAYATGETADGVPYLVMELLRGCSLHEVLQTHGRLPWQRVVAIARGACSSLREAHALGIIHRDLKPSNLHLEPGDFVKVLDFGIAKLAAAARESEPLTLAGQMIGTADYMAPEQLLGGEITARSDIFALGVVMYECLCGRVPFPDRYALTAVADPPSEWAPVPRALDLVVLRCLATDPDDRFADVDELARAIDAIGAIGAPTRQWPAATPAPPREPPPVLVLALPEPRRDPTLGPWIVLCGAILGALAGFVIAIS